MVEILSCNVQRSGSNHAAILETGAERDVDVILIQETRIHGDRQTLTKEGYEIHEPNHTWTPYLKTLIYIKKGIPTRTIPGNHPEGHMTSVYLQEQDLYIHNIY